MSEISASQCSNDESTSGDESTKVLIKFKKKRAHLRRRRDSNEEEDAEATL